MKVFLAALLLSCHLVLPSTAPAASPPKEIVIGIIPEMNVFAQMERFKPLAEYLSREAGVPVRLKILSRYGNILQSFASDQLDGAFFGSFTGALAIRKLGVEPLARPVNLDGVSTYHGLVFVRKDSGIRSFKELRGKKFAFVEKATTAGYLFPMALLKKEGRGNPDSFFSGFYFTGSHDAAIHAVLSGKADGGASKNTIYAMLREKDPRIDKEMRVLAESPRVPSNGLCVRKDLDPALKRLLKEALLNLHSTPGGQEVLKTFRALRFIETTARDYTPVSELAGNAGIDLRTYRYENE